MQPTVRMQVYVCCFILCDIKTSIMSVLEFSNEFSQALTMSNTITTHWETTWSALPWLMKKLSNLHSGRNVVCMNESQLTGRLAYTWHLTVLPYKSLTKTFVRIKVYKESHERVLRKWKWPSLTVSLLICSSGILTYCLLPRLWLQLTIAFFLFSCQWC